MQTLLGGGKLSACVNVPSAVILVANLESRIECYTSTVPPRPDLMKFYIELFSHRTRHLGVFHYEKVFAILIRESMLKLGEMFEFI